MATSNFEREIKFLVNTEHQAQLLASIGSRELTEQLKGLLSLGEFSVVYAGELLLQDDYYDTPAHDLRAIGAYVRVRASGGEREITIKKLRGQEPGYLARDEFTAEVTHPSLEKLIASRFSEVVAEYFPEYVGYGLTHIATIHNRRERYRMSRRDEDYELALDSYRYEWTDRSEMSKRQVEVEIEALNDAAVSKLPELKRRIHAAMPSLEFARNSKYHRALDARASSAAQPSENPVSNDDIRTHSRLQTSTARIQLGAAILTGVGTLAYFMWLLSAHQELRCDRRPIFIAILAISTALTTFLASSQAAVSGYIRMPVAKAGRVAFSATSGLAAIVIIVLLASYIWPVC